MNLEPVIQRLSVNSLPRVQGAGSLVELAERPPQFTPCVFVVPEREAGQPHRQLTGIFDQKIVCDYLVILIVGANGMPAAKIDEQLRTLTEQVETVLAGWVQPTADANVPTDFVSSQLMSLTEGRLTWMMRFRTERRIRRAVQL